MAYENTEIANPAYTASEPGTTERRTAGAAAIATINRFRPDHPRLLRVHETSTLTPKPEAERTVTDNTALMLAADKRARRQIRRQHESRHGGWGAW